MAIQNDNTLVTKGDLKELYTDKIAPYLGGGISYYYSDRTGEELLNLYAGLSTDSPETDSTKVWTATLGSKVPFVKISGSFIMPSPGVISIPAGTRVELAVSLADDTANTNTVFGWYNDDTNQPLEGIKDTLPWTTGGALYTGTTISQWTNSSDEAVNISYRVKILNTASKIRYRYSHLSVQEIGRIVDPVKYVSNNSDLQETPVGNIISYMGNSVPKHYLPCDGTEYFIGSYPELEAFFIEEFGSINYFGGDGTTKYAVPDLRGEFLRGTGTNGHENQGNGANVGTHQDATEHRNLMSGPKSWTNIYFENADGDYAGAVNPDSNTQHRDASNSAKVDFNSISGDYSTTHYTSRPTNTSVKYCIKYESTYHAFFSNAAYKVSVAASVAAHSGAAIAITLDNSDIIGDASLVSGNSFIAPLDGLYLIGMNWSNNGVWEQNYMINVNGADIYHVVGIGATDMLQLQKGDVVTIKTSKTSAQSGRANFALVTSNYNPTIVSADSVYSKNEQMIGYWKDGKPLYQKTIVDTMPSAVNTAKEISIGASIDIGFIVSAFTKISNGGIQPLPMITPTNLAVMNGIVLLSNDFSSSANCVRVGTNNNGTLNAPLCVTIQYTKTTDTASSLQVENSLLLNRPDLWTTGTEYSFGGGLYGKRITANNVSINAFAQLDVDTTTGATKIVSCGGEVISTLWNGSLCIPSSYAPRSNQSTFSSGGFSTGFYLLTDTHKLRFWWRNDGNSDTISYDAWVLYKK